MKGLRDAYGWAKRKFAKVQPPEDAIKILRDRIDTGERMRLMSDGLTFKQMQADMEVRFNALMSELRNTDADPLKVTRLQAQITELESLLNYVPDRVNEGLAAQAELNELTEAAKELSEI